MTIYPKIMEEPQFECLHSNCGNLLNFWISSK
jgi:hypothetical protein